MQHLKESGTRAYVLVDGERLGQIVHEIIDATSVLVANLDEVIKSATYGDQALIDDTHFALERLVALAREAQRLRQEWATESVAVEQPMRPMVLPWGIADE